MMLEEPWRELQALGVATLYEAGGGDWDLEPAITPAWPGARVCGPALTVRTGPRDNLALHRVLEHARPGQVLVADGHGQACGYWGEVLALAARQVGIVGLVIDGGVRDTDALAELGFGAFSRWIAVGRTVKHDAGAIGAGVTVGGRSIADGDIVVGDADGVLAIPASRLEDTLLAGRERAAHEADLFRRIAAGERTLDLYGLRSELTEGMTF